MADLEVPVCWRCVQCWRTPRCHKTREEHCAELCLDASGGRVAGAKILVNSVPLSVTRGTQTDDRGEFRLEDLQPSSYSLTVTAPGFDEARSEVLVAISSVREVSVTLQPKTVAEKVVVNAAAQSITTEPLDTASAVHQAVIYRQDLETIPLAARSFANIAYLAPGTEPVEPSDPTKARITAVSTGGSSGLNNEISVDGGDNSDDYIGGFLQNFSPDAIQEFAFRTAQADADTGRTTAGSVVITTRSGTNTWHGEFSVYERAAALNARFPIDNPAPNPKQPFSRQNYVGTLGGPIVKEKLWVFSSLEYVHEDASIAYSPASTAQFDALAQLASMGLIPGVNSIDVPSNVPVPFRDYLGTVRLDWAQSRAIALVSSRCAGYLHHSQRAGAAGRAAVDGCDLAQQLLQRSDWAAIHVFARMDWIVGVGVQWAPPHANAQRRSWVCAGVSVHHHVECHHRF